MIRPGLLIATVLVAGCGENLSPEEQALRDEQAVAQVEEANRSASPFRQVTPEPILYPDIERHDLYGAACNYAPGTSLGTRVVAREADAFMKVNGDVVRFAADPGSRELPMRTRSLYNSRDYSLRLTIAGEGEGATGSDAVNYEGSVTLFDAHNRIVYEGTGLAQCGD